LKASPVIATKYEDMIYITLVIQLGFKGKVALCLIKHHAMKTYGAMEV
jgi:hypothetical protein